ncbi:fatty acid-binding protein homolog 6-like [Amphiura filiformis]|uniref:fatty acid-binding protein homolog 6-like n=1 Tax=Amphiura filiformis TaxID=82378 RepID=UPI003B21968D
MATVDFSGQWKLDRNDENFEKFVQEMGINFVFRKVMGVVRPTMGIKQDGDTFEITMHMPGMNKIQTFTVGEEFDFEFPWDKNVDRMVAIWDDGKLVTKPTVKLDLPVVTREIKGDELVLTMQKGELVTRRYFKKV